MPATPLPRPRPVFALCAPLLLAAVFTGPARAGGPDYAWIEGESLAKPPPGFKVGGWGNKHYLSGETWLFGSIDGKDAAALPAAGLHLDFPFELRSGGAHEVWARLGYEFVRSPFRWRIDEGPWGTNGPEDLTTDLMEIAQWTEVAWVKLGTATLTPGKHTLHIHFERRVLPGKKQPERILAGFDCFCVSKGRFRPNGKHRPGEKWQQPIDRQAAAQVFAVPAEAAGRPRTILPLEGTWQIARFDEQEIKDRAEPVRELPADYRDFFWKGAAVPGNRDQARPDLIYCHRFLYRTRIRVPADLTGRSFVLRFPSTAMIASAFVNGRYCGGSTAPCAAWEADATAAVRPGEVNEVVVAVKDCYYALAQTGEGKSCRYMFNFPTDWFYSNGGLGATRYADFPVLLQVRGAGIFETPTLTVAGPAYVADVFAKPSVSRKELGLEVTVTNPTADPLTVRIDNEVVPLGGAAAEKTFAAKEVAVPAGGTQTVQLSERWANPKLWWPDDPKLYVVVTRLAVGGKVVDERRTKFGFREWQWRGQHFTLNGVPWHFHADLLHNGKLDRQDLKKVVSDWHKAGVNTVRYWGREPWVGKSQEETLDFFDRVGMPVRRTGTFDGEAASYLLVENKGGKTVARKAVFDHWIDQLRAWVKAQRNHPSVFVWSVENEITYINIRNFGWLDACEPEIKRAVRAVLALDPTRPAMIDGGDALRDKSLPIYGNHYNETDFRAYPDEARTMAWAFRRHDKDSRANPWPVGDDRPLFLGESFFAAGHPPAAYSALIGEPAFLGRNQAEAGVRLFARMLAEGYRWHGLAGFHFWFAGDAPDNEHYKAFQPVCVFVKEWNRTFGGGQKVTRTLKVFNDTRFPDPVELSWSFRVRGTGVANGGERLAIAPGEAKELTIAFEAPPVKERTVAELVLTCGRGGKEVFRDVKPCVILGPEPALPQLSASDITVFDPSGKVGPWLRRRGYPFREAASLDKLPDRLKLLVVGPGALTPRQATDPRWLALAAAGARVLVLDQDNPLHYQALPADLVPTPHAGRIAFPENLEHPAFAGMGKEDFFCWSGDHVVYRNAYKKSSRGSRSLLQCDDELSCTALAECPVRGGLLLLCQAAVGPRLDGDPVAGRLLDNLIRYGLSYRPVAKETVVVLPAGDLRQKLLDRIALRYRRAGDVLAALGDPKAEVVVADASPAALKELAGARGRLRDFTGRGGYLMLWGLTPEGLADFDRVVGINHVIRPFRLERVSLPGVRDPLLAGLTARDVVLESTKRIYPWSGDRYPADDTFTHVVDLDDIAPFARSEKYAHGWSQMTNGLTSADSWKFIFYHELKGDPHPKWSAVFPHEEEVTGFSIVLNTHYRVVTKLRLLFDDRQDDALTLDLRPVAELRQDFKIDPPRRCRKITLEPVTIDSRGKQPTTGVDNIWIKVKRGEDYEKRVVPLLNIGALVKYRLGKGGVILNELRVNESEANPVNAEKKQAIVAALLRNLGATFAAGRTLVAGYNLKYAPVPLDEKCTQYLTGDKGWLEGQPDLQLLPVGEQRLAGVEYVVRDFKTSPLPACIMLAGPGVKGAMPRAVEGIPVGRKADVLYFLHTFHQAREWQPSGKDRVPPAVFEYVVHYADGQAAVVPVRYGRGVGHWLAERPQGLPEAAVAWAAPLPGDARRQAVVYQMSWANPRPGVPIRSLDVRYNDRTGNGYGVPVVLAVTAATAER